MYYLHAENFLAFDQIQLDAYRAVVWRRFEATFKLRPVIPIFERNEMTECPIKPRQPTSIGITWHIQPFLQVNIQHFQELDNFSLASFPPEFTWNIIYATFYHPFLSWRTYLSKGAVKSCCAVVDAKNLLSLFIHSFHIWLTSWSTSHAVGTNSLDSLSQHPSLLTNAFDRLSRWHPVSALVD